MLKLVVCSHKVCVYLHGLRVKFFYFLKIVRFDGYSLLNLNLIVSLEIPEL